MKKFKKLFHSRVFGFVFGTVLSLILVGGGALAASSWQPTTMTTSAIGSITITPTPPPVEADYSYTLDATVLDFGTSRTAEVGGSVCAYSQAITITYTGNQKANQAFLVSMLTSPTDTSITNPQLTYVPVTTYPDGSVCQFKIKFTGTAPLTPGVVNLSGMTCTITPQ